MTTNALIASNYSAPPSFAAPPSLASLAGGGGGVNLDLDLTFTLQMLLFAVLIVALKPLLFDPVLRIFEERERRTDGARDEAREMQKKAGELLERYEAELSRVGRTAAEEREKMRGETTRLENDIINEARAATAKILADGRRDIAEQADKIRQELGRESERLGQQVAMRALGREVH
jgi:F-type H+-transporting ATPase subunit b